MKKDSSIGETACLLKLCMACAYESYFIEEGEPCIHCFNKPNKPKFKKKDQYKDLNSDKKSAD